MFIYPALFAIILLFSFLPPSKVLLKISMLMLFVIAAFRSEYVDRDHLNYISLINDSANNFYYPIEPSFKVISWFSIKFLGSYELVFLIFALISLSLKYKVIQRNSPYAMLSVLVLYSNTYILHDMTQIRAGVACAIVLYALKYLSKKRYFIYTAFILFASTFHITALLFLIAITFDKNRVSVNFIFTYWLLLLIAYTSYYLNLNALTLLKYVDIQYVQYKYNDYISQIQGTDFSPINVFSTMQILHLIVVAISFVLSRKIPLTNEQNIIIKIYSLSPLALIIFASMPVFSLRISELFTVVEIILLPLIVMLSKQRNIAKIIVVLICSCMFYINIYHLSILKDYSFFG